MKRNKLGLLVFPALLSLGLLTGCGKDGGNKKGEDKYGFIPESVLNFKGDVDVILYIEGQNGTFNDIGSSKVVAQDLFDGYLARFAAGAREFKKIAPNIRVNVTYCSIADYNNVVIDYQNRKGHLPHIMHGTEHVNEMMQLGYSADLTEYKDSELYKSFDESIMAEFNFGGFQGAVPYMIYPMGVFVNTSLLARRYQNYEDLLENYTLENFTEVCESVADFNNNIAAMPHITGDFVSYAAPTINKSYKFDRTIDVTTSLVEDLISLEKRLADTTGYVYHPDNNNSPRTGMLEIAPWFTNRNFIEDERFVFNAEMPWNLGLLSLMAEEVGKTADFDYMPWPAADEDTQNTVGMIAEGLTIGNQCPVDATTGKKVCTTAQKTAQDAAAYFAMFLSADPRALEARSKVEWYNSSEGGKMTGILDLPMTKKDFVFSFEKVDENGEEIDVDTIEPYFYKQLRNWFKCYNTWWNSAEAEEGEEPDVYEYSNIKPGFKWVLEIFYGEDETNRINFYGVPDNLPDPDVPGATKDVMGPWNSRYVLDSGKVRLTDLTWVDNLKSKLTTIQEEITQRLTDVWIYFQSCLDEYYGEGTYNVLE